MKFKSDIEVQAGLKDSSGSSGNAGSILSSTSTGVTWIDNYADWTSVVKHIVKNNGLNGTITKGTAVYVTGSNGTNMLVGRASNVSEASSSKTMGLMQSDITTTGGTQTGFVITEGLLSGLNTAGQTAGDPVWLGVNGALIYGLINKPYAPAHLVFIGIVTKVSAGSGEIFVKVQNGFELKEIHDVDIITNVPINGDVLGYDGTLWVNKTIAEWLGFTPANASGTANYVSKFTGTTTLGNSQIYDNGTNVGIGTISPGAKLDVITESRVSYSTSSPYRIRFTNTDGNGRILVDGDDSALILGTTVAGGSTATERMWIDSDGNVGIGTASPTQQLQTTGDAIIRNAYIGNIASFGTNYASFSHTSRNGVNDYSLLSDNVGITYLNASASQSLRFRINNLDKAILDSSGNFGIGTTSPANLFTVRGNGNNMASLQYNNDAGGLGLGFLNSSGTELFSIGGGRFQRQDELSISRQGTSVIYINNSNNVGIGTTTPLSILHTSGLGAASQIYVDQYGTTGSNFLMRSARGTQTSPTAVQNGDLICSIGGRGYATTGFVGGGKVGVYMYAAENFTDTAQGTFLILATTPNGTASRVERIRVTDSGNVGIGTTTPYSLLNISGSTPIFTIENSANSLAGIEFTSSIGVVDAFVKQRRDSGEFRLSSGRNSSWGGFQTFYTDTVERMRITPTGNVGIGTTTPSGKLDVYGDGYFGKQDYSYQAIQKVLTLRGDPISGVYAQNSYRFYTTPGALNSAQKLSIRAEYAGSESSDLMAILGNGNVGIGVSTPTDGKLQVAGSSQLGNTIAQTYLGVGAAATKVTSNGSWAIGVDAADGSTERMRINSVGNVGIGTSSPMYTLHVNGSVAGVGAYINLSDERYKKDILPIENALDKVLSLNGVTFNWNKEFNPETNLDDTNHIGLIAQEVENVIPQAVFTASDDNQTKSVAYSDLVPVLIEAIKEQQKQIEELKKLINK